MYINNHQRNLPFTPYPSMYHTQQSNFQASPYNNQAQIPTPYEYFAKPQQPLDWLQQMSGQYPNQQQGLPNMQAQGAAAAGAEGNTTVNFDKMLSTVGQLASTYHQVSPIVKQIGTLISSFR